MFRDAPVLARPAHEALALPAKAEHQLGGVDALKVRQLVLKLRQGMVRDRIAPAGSDRGKIVRKRRLPLRVEAAQVALTAILPQMRFPTTCRRVRRT